jgi:hypothetical protein
MKIKDGKFLYKENGKVYFRDSKGKIRCIPENKFSNGQIVKTSDKHYSKKTFTEVINPNYVESRGWIYGEQYIDRQDSGGGISFWNNEDLYENITDPIDVLFSERLILKRKIKTLKSELSQCESSLEKIEFTFAIAVPGYNKVVKKCHTCGKLCSRDQADLNRSICLDCRDNK